MLHSAAKLFVMVFLEPLNSNLLPLEQAIVQKATRLLRGITQTQPFYEGNKETALAATSVFLTLNGYDLQATNEEIFALLTGIIDGSQNLNSVEEFLLLHVRKI